MKFAGRHEDSLGWALPGVFAGCKPVERAPPAGAAVLTADRARALKAGGHRPPLQRATRRFGANDSPSVFAQSEAKNCSMPGHD